MGGRKPTSCPLENQTPPNNCMSQAAWAAHFLGDSLGAVPAFPEATFDVLARPEQGQPFPNEAVPGPHKVPRTDVDTASQGAGAHDCSVGFS